MTTLPPLDMLNILLSNAVEKTTCTTGQDLNNNDECDLQGIEKYLLQ